jgi:hypothetical protein
MMMMMTMMTVAMALETMAAAAVACKTSTALLKWMTSMLKTTTTKLKFATPRMACEHSAVRDQVSLERITAIPVGVAVFLRYCQVLHRLTCMKIMSSKKIMIMTMMRVLRGNASAAVLVVVLQEMGMGVGGDQRKDLKQRCSLTRQPLMMTVMSFS